MAKKTSIINVVVAGDSKPFRRSLGKANDSMAKFGKALGRMSIAAGVAIAGLGIKSLDLAVDFEEGLSKAKQIFGEASASIEASAAGAATAVGMSKAEYLEAAAGFGVFGKASGLAGDELSSFADGMVTTAADIASFNNLRPEEAVEKLRAGLMGSMEPLQSVGVLMTAAAVNAHAVEMGLVGVGDELTEGQKIMARHSLIMQQLGEMGSMGDFARTSDNLANKQRILNARLKNLGITMGTALIPIAERFAAGLEVVLDKFEDWAPAIKGAIGWAEDFVTAGIDLGKSLVGDIKNDIETFLTDVWPKLDKAFENTINYIKNTAIPSLSNFFTGLYEDAVNLYEGSKLEEFVNEEAAPFVENMLSKAGNFLTDLFSIEPLGESDLGFSLGQQFGNMIREDAFAEAFMLDNLIPQLGMNNPNIFEHLIPPEILHDMVYGSPSNRPTGQANYDININMPAGSDGQDVVAALQRYVRQNGAADIATSNLVRI